MTRALTLVMLGTTLSWAWPAHAADEEAVYVREIDAPFDEAVILLSTAITNANFRITGENDIGSGLRKRGYEDFPRYRIIHFCNLELAREGVLADPRLGALMPCRAAVYEHGGKVVIAMTSAAAIVAPLHNPALEPFRRKLDAALRHILDEVTH